MGNSFVGIRQHIADEFARLSKISKAQRDYLVIDQLLEFDMSRPEQLRLHTVHFGHVATLFVLDTEKQGKITLPMLLQFAETCCDLEKNHFSDEKQFETQFKAYCTLRLWNSVSMPFGVEHFATWFCRLFLVNTLRHTRAYVRDKKTTEKMIRDWALRPLQILLGGGSCGMEWSDFFNLMQRTGEEKNDTWLTDRRLDWTLPVSVVRQFGTDFIVGFIGMMIDLGFETWHQSPFAPSPSIDGVSSSSSSSSPSPSSQSSAAPSSSPPPGAASSVQITQSD